MVDYEIANGNPQPSSVVSADDESGPGHNGDRNGRFLLYWITTTSVTTITSTTGTVSIVGTVTCTPAGGIVC
jgi:hypothetical protein